MEAYNFIDEWLKPLFKGDYQDFSSKKVEGYSLFVSEKQKTPVQAMVRENILEILQNIELKYRVISNKEGNLYKSQISRWYVNGFTETYNGCRRNDLRHPLEHQDYLTLADKFKLVEDLNSGSWSNDKFRKYTINLGRREGILFYVAERDLTLSINDSPHKEKKAPIDVEKSLPEDNVVLNPDPGIEFSTMPSYQSIDNEGPDLHELYVFLRKRKVVTDIDENYFIQCVTHAYFSPIYLEGNRKNVLYVIRILKTYYEKDWLIAVCKDLDITSDRITKRMPTQEFVEAFPLKPLKK
jgi:hypothetical protein